MTLISVIIVTNNRLEQLKKAIDSVKKCVNNYEIEIIVVDNSASNETQLFLSNNYEDFHYISMGGINKGVSIPRNVAARKANGKYLYFLDDDGWVDENVFVPLKEAIERTPDVWAVMSSTLFMKRDGSYNDGRYTVDGELKPETFINLAVIENALLVKKNIFLDMGGFNESIFYGAEGEDIALRAYYRGYISLQSIHSIAYHPSSEKKTYRRDVTKELYISRCIIAKSTWPLLYGIGKTLKILFCHIPKECTQNKDYRLFTDFWVSYIKRVALLHCKRDPYISTKKFLEYKNRRNQMQEVVINIEKLEI